MSEIIHIETEKRFTKLNLTVKAGGPGTGISIAFDAPNKNTLLATTARPVKS